MNTATFDAAAFMLGFFIIFAGSAFLLLACDIAIFYVWGFSPIQKIEKFFFDSTGL